MNAAMLRAQAEALEAAAPEAPAVVGEIRQVDPNPMNTGAFVYSAPTPQAAPAAAEAATAEIDPIDDREQGDLYTYCRGTQHYPVVRRLYRLAYAQVNGLPTPPKE